MRAGRHSLTDIILWQEKAIVRRMPWKGNCPFSRWFSTPDGYARDRASRLAHSSSKCQDRANYWPPAPSALPAGFVEAPSAMAIKLLNVATYSTPLATTGVV